MRRARTVLTASAVIIGVLSAALPATPAGAQALTTAPVLLPGIEITAAQDAQIDSLSRAYAVRIVEFNRTAPATADRSALRQARLTLSAEYQTALRALLTLEQRALYDAKLAALRAAVAAGPAGAGG